MLALLNGLHELLSGRLAGFFAVLGGVAGGNGTIRHAGLSPEQPHEIGVRMAVGARRGQVGWMAPRDSLVLTALGTALGIPFAVLAGRALASSLYGIRSEDPAALLFAVLSIAVVAMAASLVPARRAPRWSH